MADLFHMRHEFLIAYMMIEFSWFCEWTLFSIVVVILGTECSFRAAIEAINDMILYDICVIFG